MRQQNDSDTSQIGFKTEKCSVLCDGRFVLGTKQY